MLFVIILWSSDYLPAATAKVRICWQLSEQSSTAEVELSGYELLVDGKHWSKVPHTWTTSIIKVRDIFCFNQVILFDIL